MTLNEARDQFEADPSEMSAVLYCKIAYEYLMDEMISDGTFNSVLAVTSRWRGSVVFDR